MNTELWLRVPCAAYMDWEELESPVQTRLLSGIILSQRAGRAQEDFLAAFDCLSRIGNLLDQAAGLRMGDHGTPTQLRAAIEIIHVLNCRPGTSATVSVRLRLPTVEVDWWESLPARSRTKVLGVLVRGYRWGLKLGYQGGLNLGCFLAMPGVMAPVGAALNELLRLSHLRGSADEATRQTSMEAATLVRSLMNR